MFAAQTATIGEIGLIRTDTSPIELLPSMHSLSFHH